MRVEVRDARGRYRTSLNIFRKDGFLGKCLFDVVNNTSTPLGRRFLKDRLASPLISHIELKNIYDHTAELVENHFYKDVENSLTCITDIERTERKMSLCILILHPFDFVYFIDSCKEVIKIYNLLTKKNKLLNLVRI